MLERAREAYKASIEYAEEKGREEGEKDKQIEIAKKMLQMGLTVEQIQEATGVSKKEIQ